MTHGFKGNRKKYQDNELIKDLQLNLMNFQARQYDPQIGRFLSVDPMAAFGGQDMFSPYAAMGNTPESNVDPNGLMPADKSKFGYGYAYLNFASTEGSRGGGATSGSGQGRDFWADGGLGDSYSSISGFGNGMDAGMARLANAKATKDLVSFVSSIMSIGGTQSYYYNAETGEGHLFDGIADGGGKEPIGSFTKSDDRGGDIPESKKWDLDGDGKLSLSEAKNWRKNGNGQSIEVDASKIDIGYINTENLEDGAPISINFLFKAEQARTTGIVYGQLDLLYNKQVVFLFCKISMILIMGLKLGIHGVNSLYVIL